MGLSGRFAQTIELPSAFRKRISKPYPDYDGYVRVVGKFEAVKVQKPKVVSRSDKMERVIITQGFGWMGTESRQITETTKLEPIGPPLPSQHRSLSRATSKEPEHSPRHTSVTNYPKFFFEIRAIRRNPRFGLAFVCVSLRNLQALCLQEREDRETIAESAIPSAAGGLSATSLVREHLFRCRIRSPFRRVG
jgi:hypothetical protein